MVYVQKGGLIQLVPEERVGRYLQDGFCVLKTEEPAGAESNLGHSRKKGEGKPGKDKEPSPA